MKIGVVSDTHGYFEPRLNDVLAGVDVIVHAGDVGTLAVLDELSQIAPVRAVAGNVDPAQLALPPSLKLEAENIQIEVAHQLPIPQGELVKWADGDLLEKMHPERREAFLKSFDDATQVMVFGHSHQPCLLTLGHRLFLNPGSAWLPVGGP
ncbi:MAG: metallophosphatase family protein [Acidobacteriia bacterium]|nr:metallophosphatase family protein [Terriglobia bacterium]